MQTTPTIKSEMDAKQCLSANSTNNNNTIFNFPTVQSSSVNAHPMMATSKVTNTQINASNQQHHQHQISASDESGSEGKNDVLDVNDLGVNANDKKCSVNVASSNHLSTSCCLNSTSSSMSSSSSFNTTNNNNNLKSHIIKTQPSQSSSCNNINVISVSDDAINPHNGIIIAETHDGASYYDAIKLEENGTTAIIYETIVIENPATTQTTLTSQQHQDILLSTKNNINNNNNECSKFVTNKSNNLTCTGASSSNTTAASSGGGIIVLTGSLNDLLLSNQNGGGGQCLNDVVKSQIQSIVLNLNSQSSAPSSVNTSSSHGNHQGQQSIMVAINSNQQVKKF